MRLIDADKLEEDMFHNAFEVDTDLQRWDSGCWIRYKMFENVIEKQPTIDAEPVRHGKWLFIRMHEDGNGAYECSLCHMGERHFPQVKVNYCWNCGAKMESEEE